MLKRKIINELLHWKNQASKKALLIKGARQVGKTTIVRQFARENYKYFVEINFERTPLARQAFDGNLDARTIIMNLSVMGFGPFEKGETLVFFDEIQSCPKARTAIKFLVEDGSYDFIESGSLLGINYKDVDSYPVGFEHQIEMFPLDFEEFLWASNVSADVIESLREHYTNITPVTDFLHQQILERLHQYFIIGGMPEVVATFFAHADFRKALAVQRDIVNSYRDDISKYAGKDKLLAKSVFDAIPQQLSKQDKRFLLSQLEKGASQRKYGQPTEWLTDAGIAYFSFNVGALTLPFALQEKRNLYKLYLLDTGLLCNMIMNNIQSKILLGDISINEGAIAENFVAAELSKHGISLDYYDRKSKQELDFVFHEDNRISVIEVKSGKDYQSHASLNAIIKMQDNLGRTMVLSKYNVSQQESVIYYPLYMTMFLGK